MKNNNLVPDLSKSEAAGVVFRAVLGLAVVIAVVLPAMFRDQDLKISELQFAEGRLTLQEPATEHRRDTFEARRLAYEAKANNLLAVIASAKVHVAK